MGTTRPASSSNADPLKDFLEENDNLFTWDAENETTFEAIDWDTPFAISPSTIPVNSNVIPRSPATPKLVPTMGMPHIKTEEIAPPAGSRRVSLMLPHKSSQPILPPPVKSAPVLSSLHAPMGVKSETKNAPVKADRRQKRKKGDSKSDEDANSDQDGSGDQNKENKKQRRLIRNRMSAQLHRERKRAYVDQLEGQIKDIREDLERAEMRASCAEAESITLRSHISKLQNYIHSLGLSIPPGLMSNDDLESMTGSLSSNSTTPSITGSSSTHSSPPSSPDEASSCDNRVCSPESDISVRPASISDPTLPPLGCLDLPFAPELVQAPTAAGGGHFPGHPTGCDPTMGPRTPSILPISCGLAGGLDELNIPIAAIHDSSAASGALSTDFGATGGVMTHGAGFARKATMLLALVFTVAMYGSPLLAPPVGDEKNLGVVASASSAAAVAGAGRPSLDSFPGRGRRGRVLSSIEEVGDEDEQQQQRVAEETMNRELVLGEEEVGEGEELGGAGMGMELEEFEGVELNWSELENELGGVGGDDRESRGGDRMGVLLKAPPSGSEKAWFTPDGAEAAMPPALAPASSQLYQPGRDAPWRYSNPIPLFPLPPRVAGVDSTAVAVKDSTVVSVYRGQPQPAWSRVVIGPSEGRQPPSNNEGGPESGVGAGAGASPRAGVGSKGKGKDEKVKGGGGGGGKDVTAASGRTLRAGREGRKVGLNSTRVGGVGLGAGEGTRRSSRAERAAELVEGSESKVSYVLATEAYGVLALDGFAGPDYKAEEEDEEASLMLMVPARSIQMGWGALPGSEKPSEGGEDMGGDEDVWVEIGCTVKYARRVVNVQLGF